MLLEYGLRINDVAEAVCSVSFAFQNVVFTLLRQYCSPLYKLN